MVLEPTAKHSWSGKGSSADPDDHSAERHSSHHPALSHSTACCVLLRTLWCSMSCINIDGQVFDVRSYGTIKKAHICVFAKNLILFHSIPVSLDKFNIYTHRYSQHTVVRWVQHGIKYLLLCLRLRYCCKQVMLPSSCQWVCLSCLKRLSLSYSMWNWTTKILGSD